jgi:hypothetical protein
MLRSLVRFQLAPLLGSEARTHFCLYFDPRQLLNTPNPTTIPTMGRRPPTWDGSGGTMAGSLRKRPELGSDAWELRVFSGATARVGSATRVALSNAALFCRLERGRLRWAIPCIYQVSPLPRETTRESNASHHPVVHSDVSSRCGVIVRTCVKCVPKVG